MPVHDIVDLMNHEPLGFVTGKAHLDLSNTDRRDRALNCQVISLLFGKKASVNVGAYRHHKWLSTISRSTALASTSEPQLCFSSFANGARCCIPFTIAQSKVPVRQGKPLSAYPGSANPRAAHQSGIHEGVGRVKG